MSKTKPYNANDVFKSSIEFIKLYMLENDIYNISITLLHEDEKEYAFSTEIVSRKETIKTN